MTREYLQSQLAYDPTTGVFTWKVKRSPIAPVGSVAGSIYAGGKRYITVARKRYLAHRLAWLFVYGEWPTQEVDHRNVNGDDNIIDNLRLTTDQGNSANRHANCKNRIGVKGVAICERKTKPPRYRARIRANDKLIHLGYYATPEEANAAYAAAAREHFGEFARAV